jgi:transcription initiation factor TFIID TATA-box-binding protein
MDLEEDFDLDLDAEDLKRNEIDQDLSISIENVVASASLDQKIDLLAIMKVFRNVEYRPKQFPGLVFRLKRPKTATLIFGSGKMVCTGAKSEKMAKRAVHKVVRELKNNGIITLGKPSIVIQNIVASANLHGKIDLETAADIMENVMYEPEQFPGLIYRMGVPKVVLLLFASGKLVCTGAKHEDMVKEAVEKLHVILQDYDLLYYD